MKMKKDTPERREPKQKPFRPVPVKVPLDLMPPIVKRSGFKRILGGALLIIGGVMTFIPQTTAIGQGLVILGGGIGAVGVGHGMVKNRQIKADTKIDKIAILRIIADLIIKILTKLKR